MNQEGQHRDRIRQSFLRSAANARKGEARSAE